MLFRFLSLTTSDYGLIAAMTLFFTIELNLLYCVSGWGIPGVNRVLSVICLYFRLLHEQQSHNSQILHIELPAQESFLDIFLIFAKVQYMKTNISHNCAITDLYNSLNKLLSK